MQNFALGFTLCIFLHDLRRREKHAPSLLRYATQEYATEGEKAMQKHATRCYFPQGTPWARIWAFLDFRYLFWERSYGDYKIPPEILLTDGQPTLVVRLAH